MKKDTVKAISMMLGALAAGVIITAGIHFTDKSADRAKTLGGWSAEEIKLSDFESVDANIQNASKIMGKNGEVSAYIVNVKSKGYGGDILLQFRFDGQGSIVQSMKVLQHNETPGIGAKITEEEFLSTIKNLEMPLYLKGYEQEEKQEELPKELKDGSYEASAGDFVNGYKAVVKMQVKDGKISSVIWDEIDEKGNYKSELAKKGEYVMTETGLKWDEQAKAVGDFVVANQSVNEFGLNEEGKTDAVTGVSISIGGFVNLIKDCIRQADANAVILRDGTYEASAEEFTNGYKAIVNMEVKDGKIVRVNWDEADEKGSYKSKQAIDGEYVMTENGPKWNEQAKAMSDYIIANQSVIGLELNEEGKTDAVAGVSISVGGFQKLIKECIAKASVNQTKLSDGTYQAEADEFTNGYKAIVNMEVKDGKVINLNWDEIDEKGNYKSKQAIDGEYVMTENGPKWNEQAKAMSDFIVQNQSVDNLNLNEEGKTDAVAGVSISVGGFKKLVKDCFTQASGGNAAEEAVPVDGAVINGISGATVSSKAVVRGSNVAYEFLKTFVIH